MSDQETLHKARRLKQLPRPPDLDLKRRRLEASLCPGRAQGARGVAPRDYRAIGQRDLEQLPQLQNLSEADRLALRAVSEVLPFRTNSYVVEELIRWEDVPNDPIFQLTFPQAGMLGSEDRDGISELLAAGAPQAEIRSRAREIQMRLNPHPAGQLELNVPRVDGEVLPGVQHKYRETVLFFPGQGQTCHAFCTYCFRWAQFVGLEEFKLANREVEQLVAYLKQHKEVTDVLFTGGDPLIMKTEVLRRYVEPLLDPELAHVTSIRIGTKATAYWPYRFVTDPDADDLLRLFEQVRASGRHLALMSHYTHPRELSTRVARKALRRIGNTGAVVRCQAPIVKHVNDHADTWVDLWREEVRLGAVPYYMFLPRDTGARAYFEAPLARAYRVFHEAYGRISGLGRTVRGPSMSTTPGKVVVDGITRISGEDVFALKFMQARKPDWMGRPFYAKFDSGATWLDQLKPAFGEETFFFEQEAGEEVGRHAEK